MNRFLIAVVVVVLGSSCTDPEMMMRTNEMTPGNYAATFTLVDKRGDATFFANYTVMGTAGFSVKTAMNGDYDLKPGSSTMVQVDYQAGNCRCMGSTSAPVNSATLRVRPRTATYDFGWSSSSLTIPVSCTKIDPSQIPACPTTHNASLDWDKPKNDPNNAACPTTSSESFDDPGVITGMSQMICASSGFDIRATWTLSATQ